jgi:hypothetical protein
MKTIWRNLLRLNFEAVSTAATSISLSAERQHDSPQKTYPPPEIRNMICKEYFIAISNYQNNSRPQPPNLLAGVRGKPDHYREVMEAYYQNYDFMLWSENEQDLNKNVSMELACRLSSGCFLI